MLRRTALALLAAVIAVPIGTLAMGQPAYATTPGTNGKIVFGVTQNGNSELYSVNPDGTGLVDLTGGVAPAWSPDGSKIAYIGSGSTPNGIHIMNADGTSDRLVSNPAAISSFGLAWSGDGSKLAYAVDANGGSDIWTVNVDGTGAIDVVSDGNPNLFPTWSPDGTKLVYERAVANTGGIVIANADGSGQVQLTTDGNGRDSAPAFSPDGTKIIFARGSQVWTMNTDGSGQAQVGDVGYSTAVEFPRFSPDGTSILVAQAYAPGHLSVMNADGSGLHVVPGTTGNNLFADWQPLPKPKFSGKIAFATNRDGNYEIYSANPDGSGLTDLTDDPGRDWEPAWSPDGSRIAFSRLSGSTIGIYVMNADGADARLLAANGGGFGVSWSGDGSKIAYAAPNPTTSLPDIWTVYPGGTNPTDIISGGQNRFPSFSADGKKIVWDKTATPDAGLWVADADGSNGVRLTDDTTGIDSQASFSPDGKTIIFDRTPLPPNSNATADLWTMNADGSAQSQLTHLTGYNAWPRYSPDGAQVVFQRSSAGSDGPFDVAVMNADGSGLRTLAANAADDEFPDWQALAQPATPSSPTAVTATAGNASATVHWTTPASPGGSAITSYTVTSSPGGKTGTVAAPATQATVSGLTNGTPYTFTVHATNGFGDSAESAPSSSVTPAVPPRSNGGFVLDDWGGIHPFKTGTASSPAISQPGPYWPGQDVVRGIASAGGGGYVVDDWGGIHPYTIAGGGVGPTHGGAYWPGQDVVRGIALLPDGSGGYVLDDWGGLHPFAVGSHSAPPVPQGGPYWAGIDAARGVTILPDGSGGYVVDSWGGLHPFLIPGSGHTRPRQPTDGPYWVGQNVVRGVAADAEGNGGYVLDDWGGIHTFSIPGTAASVPAPSAGPYWPGQDVARGISVVP